MALSKQQVWSLFLAVIMFGSILGIIGLSNSGQGQGTQEPITPPVGETPTTLSYEANNVEATVVQVFPRVIMVGQTDALQVQELRQKMLAVEGVEGIDSAEFLEPQPGQSENFRAQLRLSSPESSSEVAASLEALDDFSLVQIFPSALVSVPEKIQLTNSASGLSKEHSFPNNQLESIVYSNTKAGDSLTVSIIAGFQGESLLQAQAFELSNLSSALSQDFTSATLSVSSLGSDYVVSAKVPASELSKLQSAKTALEQSFPGTEFTLSEPSRQLTIFFSDPSAFFAEDLDTFFTNYTGIDEHSLFLDSNAALVGISSSSDLATVKASLESELNALGFQVKEIVEPTGSLDGLITGEHEAVIAAVSSASNESGAELALSRKAFFAAAEITLESGETIQVPNGQIEAFIGLERNVGDEVALDISIISTPRDGVVGVYGEETPVQ